MPCLPVVPVASRRLSWKLPWIAVATILIAGKLPSISVAIQLPRMAVEYRGIVVAIAVNFRGNRLVQEDYRGLPWKLLWFDVRGNCRGNCRGLPW